MSGDVNLADVKRADELAARKAALKSLPSAVIEPTVHPYNNPAWDRSNNWGTSNVPDGARQALVKALEKGPGHVDSILDNWILELRMSGMRHSQIAQKLGPPITEEFVKQKLASLLSSMEKILPTEMRMLQSARLEGIINMLWGMAQRGSVEHIDVLLKAIERLNKVYELETEKNKVELAYVSEAQQKMFQHSLDMAIEAVKGFYTGILRDNGILPPEPEVIDGTVADALDEAHDLIQVARDTPLVLERKAGHMVLVHE